ncbi:hypothetical protein CHUAL_013003 [Chamberlinius hualienensis]
MCSLSLFPEPPMQGFITTCEINGCLSSLPQSSSEFSFYNSSIKVPSYTCIPTNGSGNSNVLLKQSPFMEMHLDLWRKSVAAWIKNGSTAALAELCEESKEESDLTWINYIARTIMASLRWSKKLRSAFYPHLTLTDENMLQEFVTVTDWKNGPIRAFAWHEQLEKFAVAFHDDQVKIFSSNTLASPVLKYALQKNVTDLKWRPFTASVLAVATGNGVAIWTIDPTSFVTHPSPASGVQMLTKSNHSPVTSIQWSPCGRLLLSCSPRDSTLVLWDVDTGIGLPIHQSGGGVPFACWSPDAWRVFSSSCSQVFRVWECGKWTSDWWSSGTKRVTSACWSPDGIYLLVAVKDDPVIYSVRFANSEGDNSVGGAKDAIPIVNLAPVTIESSDEQIYIGGSVQSMAWDKTGTRLAVSFESKGKSQELIAVFRTKLNPSLIVTPCGFVRGYSDDLPQCFAFRDNVRDGVMLTVCWSSGKLTHVRFLTNEESTSGAKSKSPVMNLSDRLFSITPNASVSRLLTSTNSL